MAWLMAQHVPNHRPYSAGEIFADAVLHGIALCVALYTLVTMMAGLTHAGPWMTVLVAGQGLAVCIMLAVSGVYNTWPISSFKWWLRRFDHAFIFILIAATYAAPLALVHSQFVASGLGLAIWAGALAGASLKMFWPGRHERLAIAAYLVLGWAGVLAFPAFAAALPVDALWLYILGGVVYTLGVPFYLMNRLRYNIVIWHGFVAVAAIVHLHAVGAALAG
jgi:hemolysin III